ncbi:MAG: hypothetical protein JWO80_5812 [Bryobacterales bacterium]|nr:hypothetical protein [Bryobacterales bacterium]
MQLPCHRYFVSPAAVYERFTGRRVDYLEEIRLSVDLLSFALPLRVLRIREYQLACDLHVSEFMSFAMCTNRSSVTVGLLTLLASAAAAPDRLQIPNRPASPVFKGQQGKQRPEIHFDPSTGEVTIKLLVQDPNGYFIPNIRRENFAVFDNGVKQNDVTVDVEHASVSLGLLMEYGGRYQTVNQALSDEVSRAGHQLLTELKDDDQLAIWRFADKVERLTPLSRDHSALEKLVYSTEPPKVSETNLYDAVIAVVGEMQPVAGRKGIILIASGLDTFSKATYEDALQAARNSTAPIYAIGLARVLRDSVLLHASSGPAARLDWNRADANLGEIARASGGRFYSPEITVDMTPVYDDIMENLRVRYVLKYKLSTASGLDASHTVRVELVDPKTGGPLQITDANGRAIRAKVIAQETYVPAKAR